MLEKILPFEISNAIERIGIKGIYEIRLRVHQTIRLNFLGQFVDMVDENNKPIKCSSPMLTSVIAKAVDNSLYSVNDQIVKGFITVEGGIRIGLCGELVWESGHIKTIKNFTSVNIRIPHDIENCSKYVIKFICQNNREVASALIVSPPGKGKTTILRDISRRLSGIGYNTLIVDERNEICACKNGEAQYNVGTNCDYITNGNKLFAFEYGIRSLSPQVIVTDELMDECDAEAVLTAIGCGVKVIASAHASNLSELRKRLFMKKLFDERCFERIVVLSKNKQGSIDKVYNSELKEVI